MADEDTIFYFILVVLMFLGRVHTSFMSVSHKINIFSMYCFARLILPSSVHIVHVYILEVLYLSMNTGYTFKIRGRMISFLYFTKVR